MEATIATAENVDALPPITTRNAPIVAAGSVTLMRRLFSVIHESNVATFSAGGRIVFP